VSAERIEALAALARERELDALLVTNLVNVRWLTGFSGTNGAAVLGAEPIFVTDFRYTEHAAEQVDGFEIVIAKREMVEAVAERLAAGRVGFDDAHVTVKAHTRLGELVEDGVELVPAAGLVERLRAVKDAAELDAIRAAAALADEIYAGLRERGLVGRSELEVAREIEAEIRARGAEPSFPPIVAAGAHGALPHAEPRSEPAIGTGELVVVDLGAKLDDYCSDCTRTFATGELSAEATAVYELVRTAQERSLEAVKPGAVLREVDAVARKLIDEAGHGDHFGHGLGHGVGLEVHEEPRVAQSAEEGATLDAGNVVTVEPGVYLSGELGVRIEDLVVVTDTGNEVLTHFPKELIVAGA